MKLHLFTERDEVPIRAPLLNLLMSLLLVAMSLVIIIGYGGFWRCQLQSNAQGTQQMRSVADCDNLEFVTCVTTCEGIQYAMCDGSSLMQGLPNVSNTVTCRAFYDWYYGVTNIYFRAVDYGYPGLGRCTGTLKSTRVCQSPLATVGQIGGYLSLIFSSLSVIHNLILRRYYVSEKFSDETHTKEIEVEVQ